MANPFFEQPILNSPYECPARPWELDQTGQPTQRMIQSRRLSQFITPIPKPKKRKKGEGVQKSLRFDDVAALETVDQQYDTSSLINNLRDHLDRWRNLPNPNDWQVTPETARLLQHWRHHKFSGVRPFFCQIEAVETFIWLTEVAPQAGKAAKALIDYLDNANNDANPGLARIALKLATGVFNGAPPQVVPCKDEEDELQFVSNWLKELRASGVEPHEIGIFVRAEAQLDRATGAAKAAGLLFRVLDERVEAISGQTAISTMHLAKGLEFRAVVVMACDDEVIPLQERIESVTDESDLKDVYDTERHLLYVACTRARDHLLITSASHPSEFLDDMSLAAEAGGK